MSNLDKRVGALRRETELLNDGRPTSASIQGAAKRLPPISEEELTRLGKALLWRIVLEPWIPEQRGLIATAPQVDDAERVLSKVGRIVLMGAFAWQSKTEAGLDLNLEPHKPGVGDYVLHEMYAGTEVHLTTGHTLRILTETECLLVVKDPSIIRGYL